MSRMRVTTAITIQSLKTRRALLAMGFFMLFAQQPGHGQAPAPDALKFFKNYFVTGDYVSAGVNLRGDGDGSGFATGEIHFPGVDGKDIVPANADILAAFLYWESVIKQDQPTSGYSGARFRGELLQTDDVVPATLAYELNPAGSAPCWSSGGGAGSANGAHRMKAYRADVLRFLPIGTNPAQPNYGKRLVNDDDLIAHGQPLHTVTMPEPGSGNQVPSTAGASLVVIYRDNREDVDPDTAGPQRPALRSIVIYNGGWTMDQNTDFMSQKVKGFYQSTITSGTTSPVAKMTHIVGDGQPNFFEQALFNGGVIFGAPGPFAGAASTSPDPAWDNWTYYFGSGEFPGDTGEVTVRVDHGSFTPFDCLSWGAIVLSTTVQDQDDDGIVDKWETSRTITGPVEDPNGQALPDLFAMGARPNKKDVFVEVGYLKAPVGGYANPFQGPVTDHNHLPAKEALDMVGNAFKNAPVSNPDGTTGINVHFDVGNNYQTNPADPYIINWTNNASNLARGGESIVEDACDPSATQACLFPKYPGTVGWKTAFRFLRDQPLSLIGSDPPIPDPSQAQCVAAETDTSAVTTCVRRFDRNRKDIFHYALFAHALGVQRLDDPNTTTVDESLHADIVAGGVRDPIDCDLVPITQCAVPSGVSGTGDGGGSGGGDLMVTLGFWDNLVGTPFIQASTLMHELGHNFGFRHGAGPPVLNQLTGTVEALPNCKPNYQSVMNYLFQIRGLIVGQANSPVAGVAVATPVIDYSRQTLNPLSENSLTESSGLPSGMIYRTGWYSPSSLVDENLGAARARRHCDGTFLSSGEVGSFRITGTSLTSIDWNANLIIDPGTNLAGQDVNFNGGPNPFLAPATPTDGPFSGSNDWASIDLRQVGSRRNVASDAVEDFFGPLSLDQGVGDNGVGDNGVGDNGVGDNGVGDNGVGDNGVGDNGVGDNGVGDNGVGDNGAPPEVDPDTAKALGNTPNTLTAKLVSKNIQLSWFSPHVTSGDVNGYEVWRVVGQTVDNTTWLTRVMVGTKLPPWPLPPAPITFTDLSAKNNVWYTYFVVAIDDGAKSGPSNFVTIKK